MIATISLIFATTFSYGDTVSWNTCTGKVVGVMNKKCQVQGLCVKTSVAGTTYVETEEYMNCTDLTLQGSNE